MVEDLVDERRTEPPYLLADREMLDAWLEFHRTTLLLKCEGLDDAQRKARPVPTSELSLHGLVRHMAEVERNWFSRVLLSAPQTPFIWADPNVESSELLPLDDADWIADLAVWQAQCETSRSNAAGKDLSVTGQGYGEAGLAALDLRAHDRGIRAPQRTRRPDPRARRRRSGLVSSGRAGELAIEQGGQLGQRDDLVVRARRVVG